MNWTKHVRVKQALSGPVGTRGGACETRVASRKECGRESVERRVQLGWRGLTAAMRLHFPRAL
eukprot:3541138-Rhodomonas_salina.3